MLVYNNINYIFFVCLQGAKKINIGSTLCKIHTVDNIQYSIERYRDKFIALC